jgi:hypothetical protein
VALKSQAKSEGVGKWEKRCESYWVLGPSCVLGCSSAVVVESAYVMDCRGCVQLIQ